MKDSTLEDTSLPINSLVIERLMLWVYRHDSVARDLSARTRLSSCRKEIQI
jgi:hypothetical protein